MLMEIPDINEIKSVLDNFILSASGWRKVFARDGDEESATPEIRPEDAVLTALAAETFAFFLKDKTGKNSPTLVLGTDTRPTGRVIAEVAAEAFKRAGMNLLYPGVAAAPEIMAYSRTKDGFAYISASHNPIGHNGIKFGLSDGGVLGAEDSSFLIEEFKKAAGDQRRITRAAEYALSKKTDIFPDPEEKEKMLSCYENFTREVISSYGSGSREEAEKQRAFFAVLENEVKKAAENGKPVSIFADFNGSARSVSIDRKFIESTGISFFSIHERPGEIAHRIVPEGKSLDYGAQEMLRLRNQGETPQQRAVTLGYVPDCDGDRGNIIFWNEKTGKMETLEAQQVFALAVIAELAYTAYITGGDCKNHTVVVNDPTSMRIEAVTEAFNAETARAEVGEANVVNLARKLREEGRIVRILGEGSNGGNITHPSAVRDPLNTVFALLKLLLIKDSGGKEGVFHIWLNRLGKGHLYRDDFTLADVIETIPPFTTTSVFEEEARIKVKTQNHSDLKRQFQKIFLSEWEKKKEELSRFGITGWTAVCNNGTVQKENIQDFGESGKGGLKIIFTGESGGRKAFIWMRGSGTEPVFRILADVEGRDNPLEKKLAEWLASMLREADT